MIGEKEALTKLCPLSFSNTAKLCQGQKCMLWRLEMTKVPAPNQPTHEWLDAPTGRGCCGLNK